MYFGVVYSLDEMGSFFDTFLVESSKNSVIFFENP